MSCSKGVGRNSSCQRQLHPVRTVYMISIWAWRYKNMRPTLCVQQNKTSENTALRAQSPATGALVNSYSELWAKAANRKCSASQWLQHLRHCARGECLLAVDFFISEFLFLKAKKTPFHCSNHIVLHNSEKCCNMSYKFSKQQMLIFYITLTKVSYFLSLNIKFCVYFYNSSDLLKVKLNLEKYLPL